MLKCILAKRFELCIDKGYEVRELTSKDKDWEAGTTIVMRIVLEEFARAATRYKCSICGCEIYLETGAIDDTAGIMAPVGVSAECQGCQARHQVFRTMAFDPWEPWVGINDIDGTTDPAFFRVRNYRLQQVEVSALHSIGCQARMRLFCFQVLVRVFVHREPELLSP
ncbi:hypothetical protein SCLCIDRAFT_1104927 [Scleroderma citrinum Foug A]|uniref:Uncharacterized protein n=1 Tax=Scleroderma citrinum Foug A TaxID=1036808 RepID=A0A0C3A1E6_9AGAM|nr:hypothetical protein SCLCIDRAFT_1104927 [Scleroderma citrinum Foug A]